MLKKIIITVVALFFFAGSGFTAPAAENDSGCRQLDEKASGDRVKYSLYAEVNGPIFFNDIGCGIRYRNSELCAMEMVSFDMNARVYDYYTAEKIDIGKAYFWLDDKDPAASIQAFSSKEAAEKFTADTDGGVILDYTELTNRMLR